MSRSFFAPEGGGQSAQDTRLNLGPSSSTTTEYRRYSPPPTSSSGAAATSEDKQPFLPNGGHSDQGSIGRAASIGGVGGLGSASAGGASDSLAGMKALPPILSYCSASIMMTVINKVRSCESLLPECCRTVSCSFRLSLSARASAPFFHLIPRYSTYSQAKNSQ